MKQDKKMKIRKDKNLLLLVFKPFIQISKKRILLIPFRKEKIDTDVEWSLDCSGQGECQPNVSPSDGDEKMDFLNEAMEQQKRNPPA